MPVEQAVTELIVDGRQATSGAAAIEAAFVRAGVPVDQLQSKIDGVVAQQVRLAGTGPQSVDRVTLAYQKLQSSIDPVTKAQFAMERDMTRSMALVNRAVTLGVTTEQEAAATLSRLRAKQVVDLDRVRQATEQLGQSQVKVRSAANQNVSGTFNTANIAAQFQDIGVTAAMGMNPLQIALQQGTQLSAVLGPMGAAGAARSLGAALLSVVNPVSLITLGLVAAAAAAIQYFMNWKSSSDDSAEALKEQVELISKVATQWKGAVPALAAYNDELKRTENIQSAIAAGQAAAQQQYGPARQQVPGLNVDISDAVNMLQQLASPEDLSRVVALQDAFAGLAEKVKNSTATGADALSVSRQLNDLLGTYGVVAIGNYAKKFEELAAQLDANAEKARKFREEAALLEQQSKMNPLNPLDGFNRTPFQTEEDIRLDRQRRQEKADELKRGSVGIPIPQFRGIDDQPASVDLYRELTKAGEDRARQLQTEAGAFGLAGAALIAYRTEQEALNMALSKGIELSPDQLAGIHDIAVAYGDAADQLAKQKDVWAGIQGVATSTIDKIVDSFARGGKDIADVLRQIAADIIKLSLTLSVSNPLKNWLTGSDLPTMGDVGAMGGVLGKLFGRSGAGAPAANDNFSAPVGQVISAPLANIGSFASAGLTKTGIPLAEVSAQGLVAKVRAEYADRFQGLFNELSSKGYKIGSLGEGGYSYRNVAGTNNLSKHAFGEAVDINPRQNPYAYGAQGNWADYGIDPSATAKKYGLTYGGDWRKPDTMHFQVDKTAQSLDRLTTQSTQATHGLATFGGGLDQLGKALSGGGGGGGALSGLFGAGVSLASMLAISPAATRDIASGSWGAFAGGTENAPAGWAWVGEEGPELRKLRAGDVVRSNPRSAQMAASANNNGGSNVSIVVNNAPAGTNVRESRRRGPDGRELREMVIDIVSHGEADGEFDAPRSARYGARPLTATRGR